MKIVKLGENAIAVFLVMGLLIGMPRHARSEALPQNVPVTVTADKLDYDRANDVYIAVGHVKIEQEGVRLEADKVVLNNKSGEASAEGNVVLRDKGDVTRAAKLRINISTRKGIIYQGDIFIQKESLHLKGEVIERRSETVYHIEKGAITTCDEDQWYLKAKELNVDMDRYATGKGVSFNVQGVPVFYSPYFLFPVRRQSGFLIPEVGHSSLDGWDVGNTFFWAISDHTDMTIYSDYRERTGHGTALEYRYANSRESAGQAYYKYWDLYHTRESRWEFRFHHQEEFADDLSGRVDINLVSDQNYYSDLEKRLELRSKPYLDSNAFYVERWNTASLYLLGQYSTDLTRANEKTVQKAPEIRYSIYEEQLAGPLHLNFEGSAANFTQETGNGLRRVDFNPQLTAPLGGSGLSVTPRAGARATFYDHSSANNSGDPTATTNEPTERKYAYAGIEVNARLSRVYGADGESGIGRVRHSLEPNLTYNYIPHIEQGSLPQFDSMDSVVSMSTVTVSLTNRVTAHYKEAKETPNFTTFDLLVFKLSSAYDLHAARDQNGMFRPWSDLFGDLYLKTPKMFSLSASGSYNTYERALSSYSVGAGFTSDIVSLNLGEQYLRDQARYVISGGGLKLGKWNLSGQWWRDTRNNVTTQEEYRVKYGSQCWGINLAYITTPGEKRYLVLFNLTGLGEFGLK
jgi:LPS-assembly protein